MSFEFRGLLSSSKSLFNRALIVQSFFPQLNIHGFSKSEDVLFLREALRRQQEGSREFFVGEGGTTLRFLAVRLSRLKGEWILKGSERLFQRPHQALWKCLEQLGVDVQVGTNQVTLVSQGWKKTSTDLKIETAESTQFLSAILLSSWNLDFDLTIESVPMNSSQDYFLMTAQLLQRLGMELKIKKGQKVEVFVPRQQRLQLFDWTVEIDLSSAFSLAAAAAANGHAILENFPEDSLQPDIHFLEILSGMGVPLHLKNGVLEVSRVESPKPVSCSLKNSPDLFPCLSALCGFANGESSLQDLNVLKHKESDRRQRMRELLEHCSIGTRDEKETLVISGSHEINFTGTPFVFDPDQDHRLAMAAAVLKLRGFPLEISNPEVVNKSFPEFWKCIGMEK